MSDNEGTIQRRILIAASKAGLRLFRNNTALGWVGQALRISKPTTAKLEPGDVVIRNARPLHAGLCVGSSDLIGWAPRLITAEDVGKTLAVFCSVEVKTPKGRASQEQRQFLKVVSDAGGVALIARHADDIAKITPKVQN